jgi:hypothetical protein
MERTNFEKLQVYQLSEKIADNIWNIVLSNGIRLQKTPLESKSCGPRIALALTLRRAAVEVVFKTIGDLSEWREALWMKLYIGCAGLIQESCCRKPKLRNCVG